MDPISAILGFVGSLVYTDQEKEADKIKEQQANAAILSANYAAMKSKTDGENFQKLAMYALGGLVVLVVGFVAFQALKK